MFFKLGAKVILYFHNIHLFHSEVSEKELIPYLNIAESPSLLLLIEQATSYKYIF